MLSINIKEATKGAHLNLEKIVVRELKSIKDDQDYAVFLQKFYTYFSQVEQAIAPFITPEILPDQAERRNSLHLKDDIESLGFNVYEVPKVEVPVIKSSVEALAALYVMEGSIMGGKIIVQMLNKLGVTKGISFFSGYGAETGPKWSVFTAVLDEAAKTAEEQEHAVNTANRTFQLFEKVF